MKKLFYKANVCAELLNVGLAFNWAVGKLGICFRISHKITVVEIGMNRSNQQVCQGVKCKVL